MGPSPGWVQAGSVAAPGGGLQAMLSYLKELTCLVFEGKKTILIEVKEELASDFSRDVSRRQAGNAPTAGTVISEHERPVLQPLSLPPRPLAAAPWVTCPPNGDGNACTSGRLTGSRSS